MDHDVFRFSAHFTDHRANASVLGHISVAILHVILFASLCTDGLAQSNPVPPAQSIRLSLKDAVQLALKQNPRVMASRLLSLESDRERQKIGRAHV